MTVPINQCLLRRSLTHATNPNRYSTALDLVKRATASAPPVGTFFSSKKKSSIAVSDNVQKDIWRNTKIWHLYADLEESINSFESARTVYERMIELKVCTAASVLQYAAMLEEHRYAIMHSHHTFPSIIFDGLLPHASILVLLLLDSLKLLSVYMRKASLYSRTLMWVSFGTHI